MRGNTVPSFLRQFIHDHINSVEQMEVLLLLRDEPKKWWSAVEVAKHLLTTENSASMRLADLYERRFLERTKEHAVLLYRYNPTDYGVEETITALDRAYRERKDSVIQIIFTPPPNRLQSFADAFVLRRND